MSSNWLITIPKTVSWDSWLAEVSDARAKGLSLFYRLPRPINCYPGDRCFILWNGKVRGWLPIIGVTKSDGFTCNTTGAQWPPGFYIERKPVWNPVDGPELQGFRGARRLPLNFLDAILNMPR